MMLEKNDLISRASDLIADAMRGIPRETGFLTPKEEFELRAFLSARHIDHFFFGGYSEAERKKCYLLPDYIPVPEDGKEEETQKAYFPDSILTISISGSKYNTLTNRDYLGAVMNLGIERSTVGDIRETSPHSAILFSERPAGLLLLSDLTRVGREAVSVVARGDISLIPPRQFLRINDTVQSPRLDGVVAALCRLSREDAKNIIQRGDVLLNYREEAKPDRPVFENDILTVKGHGKYKMISLSEQNKRGRLRLAADKYC